MTRADTHRVGLIRWYDSDEISDMIRDELTRLGREVVQIRFDAPLPADLGILFSFGPLGPFWPLLRQLNDMPPARRPVLAHWGTEGMPSPRISGTVVRLAGAARAFLDRAVNGRGASYLHPPIRRALRFRYFGEYRDATRRGLLNVLADSSILHVNLYERHGMPALFAPWGISPRCHADLGLERDIDVLWIGKRGSRRRARLLDRVRRDLRHYGVEMYVCDGEERPFVFGEERTRILNRAKVTINIARTWHDDNFSRFSFAIPNRSLIVSEVLLPHCPAYIPGRHYVSVPAAALAQTIHRYLKDDAARQRIVEEAYHFALTELRFTSSIELVLKAADEAWLRRTGTPSP